jgi:hypothetical protein
MSARSPTRPELPPAYRWAVSPDSAVLFLRYGWVATVRSGEVRIGADPPLYPETRGPCRSVAHGQRIVESILAVRLRLGPPERQAVRERIRADRVRRKIPRPPYRPQEDDAWLNP